MIASFYFFICENSPLSIMMCNDDSLKTLESCVKPGHLTLT